MAKVALSLKNPSKLAATTSDGPMVIRVNGGKQCLWADNAPGDGKQRPEASFNPAVAAARRTANHFLNELAARYDEINGIDHHYAGAERIGSDGVRRAGVTRVATEFGAVNANGHPVNTRRALGDVGEIKPKDSQAANYFRRAKMGSDPFDIFRNFYRVLENMADKIREGKKISKGSLKEVGSMRRRCSYKEV